MRQEETDLFMNDEKPTSAKYMDASKANYSELDAGQHQEVVALENDKKRYNCARRRSRQEVHFRG